MKTLNGLKEGERKIMTNGDNDFEQSANEHCTQVKQRMREHQKIYGQSDSCLVVTKRSMFYSVFFFIWDKKGRF